MLKEYHNHLKVFDKKTATRFPKPKPWNHVINLKPDFKLQRGKIYSLSPKEQEEVDKFIDENLDKQYIQPSKSPQASSFFFIPKKVEGVLRPCQDYQKLNKGTIKNAYSLSRIDNLLDKIKQWRYFTKLNIQWRYNNV